MTQTPSYTTRPATLNDATIICHHRNAMFAEIGHNPASVAAMDNAFGPWLQQHMPRGEYIGWMIEDDDRRIIGGGGVWTHEGIPNTLMPHHRTAHVVNIYVEPEYRRQGIARHIMETIIEWAKAEQIAEVTLHASREGLPLYKQLGFTSGNHMTLML
ncbi:MAG: GNAT family N-acetyltransferase [Chloroflexota bacterium]